jgi:hypothetical protein
MDALYVFQHSAAGDQEIRYSLRSLARNVPFLRKVWVFGDRPAFISNDTSRIEHVPHEYVARLDRSRVPIRNFFKMMFMSSLIGDLDAEYLWMCDDFLVLEPISESEARRVRYMENMAEITNRGTGLWKEALWKTYDLLSRLGYPGLNFEVHCPTYLRRKWVFDAYCDLQDFVTEDRFFGLTGPSAILNHALRFNQFPVVKLADENWKAGFYEKPSTYAEIVDQCRGRRFLNFDDNAFGEDMLRFLSQRFPTPCFYEMEGAPAGTTVDPLQQNSMSIPVVVQRTERATFVATTSHPVVLSAEAATRELALELISRQITDHLSNRPIANNGHFSIITGPRVGHGSTITESASS